MNSEYKVFRDQAFSALNQLARQNPIYEDAQMLVASAETHATLMKHNVLKSIDTDWVEAIEKAIPALDLIIRNPAIHIEDVDEILPVELSRHITDKSVKHLAQHTNLILDIQDDDVIPQKILNVYHDETYLTYENKFVNTLLARLSAFVDKRYAVLADGRGAERFYNFGYTTEFEHHLEDDGGRNTARINLRIELTSPLNTEISESIESVSEMNERYAAAVARIKRIKLALTAFQSSAFAAHLGRNYIRPPVIRTNAILKNKNLKECLLLWEYIESYDKVGYAARADEDREMPSDEYISDLYSAVALEYVNFYNGVTENDGNRLLSRKHLFDVDPDFSGGEEELDDYFVYDSEYRKLVPVSRLMNNKKKLSEDEKRISVAILVALQADELIEQRRREEEERRRAEEEARRLAEEEARRRAEEEARRLAEEEAARALAEAEAKRLAEEEARRLAEEEARRLAEEAERRRAEEEAALLLENKDDDVGIVITGDLFAPDDGEMTGRYPVCPYTRRQYLDMTRKKKKIVKKRMAKVIAFRDAQPVIEELRAKVDRTEEENADLETLVSACNSIVKELSFYQNWCVVIKLHEQGNASNEQQEEQNS